MVTFVLRGNSVGTSVVTVAPWSTVELLEIPGFSVVLEKTVARVQQKNQKRIDDDMIRVESVNQQRSELFMNKTNSLT